MLDSHTTYASVGTGGAIAIVVSWLSSAFLHKEMPPDVAISLGTLVSMVAGYFFHQVRVTQVTQGVTK